MSAQLPVHTIADVMLSHNTCKACVMHVPAATTRLLHEGRALQTAKPDVMHWCRQETHAGTWYWISIRKAIVNCNYAIVDLNVVHWSKSIMWLQMCDALDNLLCDHAVLHQQAPLGTVLSRLAYNNA